MTSVFLKRIQKFFLYIQKQQRNELGTKEVHSAQYEQYVTIEKKLEFSCSGGDVRVDVSESDDGLSIRNSWKKSISSSFSRSERGVQLQSSNNVDDEDRSPPSTSTERLKASIPLSRIVAPKSREEVEIYLQRSESSRSRSHLLL